MKSIQDLLMTEILHKVKNNVNNAVSAGVQYQVDEATWMALSATLEPMVKEIGDTITETLHAVQAGHDESSEHKDDGRLTRE